MANGTADGFWLVGGEVGFDRTTRGRWCGDQAHLPHAGKRHVEGAGDGCGTEGEDIHLGFHCLDFLLLVHTKALLLIDNEQSQLAEAHLLAQELMGADNDINFPCGQFLDDLLALLSRAKAIQQRHLDGIGGEAFFQGVVVLLRQNGGGGEERDLFAAHHRLEDGTQGDLGFAEADIPANETIHGTIGLHIPLHVLDCLQLVGGGLIGEGFFQFLLPGHIQRKGIALLLRPLSIELK